MSDKYIQDKNTEIVYKVMDNYLLQMSPWEDGNDRRVHVMSDVQYDVITYQNACMIVNKQFAETDEGWKHNGKQYLARAISRSMSTDEHVAMLSMLPTHYVRDSNRVISKMEDGSMISVSDHDGNEFKMVKHKGKVYYMLIVNQILPKVKLYDTFGKFCQLVNIKNVKPIYCETDKRYI